MKTKLSFFLLASLAFFQTSPAQISYLEITSDLDSGVSSDLTYTHAVDFGTTTVAEVNGVVFANAMNEAIDDQDNAGTRTYGPNRHPGNAPPAVTGGISEVFRDMHFNGPDPGVLELTGLTPGTYYELRLYERAWDFQGSTRTYSLAFDIGADGTIETNTPKINQNDSSLATPGFFGNVSYALIYKYQADDNGSLRITIDLADDQTGTYHLYGFTNAIDPNGPSNYSLTLNDSSFNSGAPQGALIGNLVATSGGNPDPSTFTLVPGTGDTDNDKFQIIGDRLEVGTFDFTGANSIDGQQYSIRIQGTGNNSAQSVFILNLLKDDDNDNLLDEWEIRWATNLDDLSSENGDEDLDQDGLTNLEEFQISRGTFGNGIPAYPDLDPTTADTDDDSLTDGAEITPIAPRLQTDPTNPDTDGDLLDDAAESNTGTFTDANDAGTDPTNCDSDGDFAIDGWETTYNSDPTDPNSFPAPVGPVAIVPITDDASTGLDPAKTYTHLISGGQSATVNGVTFDTLAPGVSPADFTWDPAPGAMSQILAITGDWDPISGGISTNVEALLASFTYSNTGANPGSSQRFTLSNLTPGVSYDLRIYSRIWDTDGAGRPSELIFTNGDEIVQPFGNLPTDRAGLITGSGSINDAYYLTYQYTAQTTDLIIDTTVPLCAPGNSGSFHMYALSNEVATGVPLGQILITDHVMTQNGQFIIAFKAKPQTTYQVTKSSTLIGDFSPLDLPLSVTTDVNGDGQAVIPASEASELAEFYRIEE